MLLRLLVWLVFCGIFSAAHAAGAGHKSLAFPADLRAVQVNAVVVLFSLPNCAYCEKVRQQSLNHVETDPHYRGRVKVYEIDFSDQRKPLVWFDGRTYSGKSLATLLNVRFSPTVMVFGQRGEVAGKPILGASLPEFYGAYLDDLIQAAWGM